VNETRQSPRTAINSHSSYCPRFAPDFPTYIADTLTASDRKPTLPPAAEAAIRQTQPKPQARGISLFDTPCGTRQGNSCFLGGRTCIFSGRIVPLSTPTVLHLHSPERCSCQRAALTGGSPRLDKIRLAESVLWPLAFSPDRAGMPVPSPGMAKARG
jgi:hypothetical protein